MHARYGPYVIFNPACEASGRAIRSIAAKQQADLQDIHRQPSSGTDRHPDDQNQSLLSDRIAVAPLTNSTATVLLI
eukprot:5778146-Amphidinium_carterae.1